MRERLASGLTRVHFEGDAWERRFHRWSVSERIMDGTANRFPATNALDCRISHVQSQTFSNGSVPRCLDPDTNFRLARQRSHCSCFTKRPLGCTRWQREARSERVTSCERKSSETNTPLTQRVRKKNNWLLRLKTSLRWSLISAIVSCFSSDTVEVVWQPALSIVQFSGRPIAFILDYNCVCFGNEMWWRWWWWWRFAASRVWRKAFQFTCQASPRSGVCICGTQTCSSLWASAFSSCGVAS